MKLMTETVYDTRVKIEEGAEGKKDFFIEGVFMQSDIKNRNGRIYPKAVMENQLKSYNETFVSRKRALGELGHPENPSVNLERVSHNIVALEYKSNTDVWGKAKLMDTPYGNIAKSFVREGVELGVSSRGLGSIRESNGARVVQGDFFLSAVDIVADPSAPSAFVNGIMEGREWIFQDGVLVEREIEQMKDAIDADTRTGGAKFAESNVFNHLDALLANAQRLSEGSFNLGTGRKNRDDSVSSLIYQMVDEVKKAVAKGASDEEVIKIKDKYVVKIKAYKAKRG